MKDGRSILCEMRPHHEHGRASRREATLLVRSRAGDGTAFGLLVEPHLPPALRAATAVVGRDDGGDVVQSALVRAYRGLPGFALGQAFRPWLLQIVFNEGRTARRRAQRRAATLERAAAETCLQPVAESSEAAALRAEEAIRVRRAIRSLPRRYRDVVVCRFLLELTEAETSVALAVPAGTVKSRLSRALERLRRELRDDACAGGS